MSEKKQQPADKQPEAEKEAKAPTRRPLTANVTIPEYEHVFKIFSARQAAGLSATLSDFVIQCVDFAINHNAVFKTNNFAVPDDVPPQLLQKGFYRKQVKHIPVCQ